MRTAKLIEMASKKGQQVLYIKRDGNEIITLNRHAIYVCPTGTVKKIRDKGGIVERWPKLEKHYDLMHFVEDNLGSFKEAIKTADGKTKSGNKAIELSTSKEHRWINPALLAPFGSNHKCVFYDYGWHDDQVHIVEKDKVVGVVMTLKENLVSKI